MAGTMRGLRASVVRVLEMVSADAAFTGETSRRTPTVIRIAVSAPDYRVRIVMTCAAPRASSTRFDAWVTLFNAGIPGSRRD